MLVDAMASLFVSVLLTDGYWQLALMIVIITVGLNIVFLRKDAYPLRWLSPGLSLLLLLSVYPVLFTIYIAFTNFGTGHLLPKVQVIELLQQRRYLPEDGKIFQYVVYRSATGDFALWLQGDDGAGFLALPAGQDAADIQIGSLDADGIPNG